MLEGFCMKQLVDQFCMLMPLMNCGIFICAPKCAVKVDFKGFKVLDMEWHVFFLIITYKLSAVLSRKKLTYPI